MNQLAFPFRKIPWTTLSKGGGTCEEGSFSSCSSFCGPAVQYGHSEITVDCPDNTNNSDTINDDNFEVVINQSYQDKDQMCNFEFDINFAVCHVIHSYSSVNISSVQVSFATITIRIKDISRWAEN